MKYCISAIALAVCLILMMGGQVVLDVTGGPGGLTAETAVFFVVGLYFARHTWLIGRGHEQRIKQYVAADAKRAALHLKTDTPLPCGFDDLVSATERRLRSSGFLVSRDVVLPNGDTVALAASRTEFTFPGVVNVPVIQHLFLWHPRVAAVADFDALFEGGFQYATHQHHGSLLRRERFGHVVLPCIAVDTATPALVTFASSRPPRRWMRFEFPVLYDLSTGRMFYYEGNPRLGAMLFPGARALANLAFDIAQPRVAA